MEDSWRGVYRNVTTRTSAAPHEEGAVTRLVQPARAADVTSQRERLRERGFHLWPASALQRSASAVDAEPGCQRRASVSFIGR